MEETARHPGFLEATGSQTASNTSLTANQVYKKMGGKDGTGLRFSEWLEKQKADGKLDELINQANQKNTQIPESIPPVPPAPEDNTEKKFLWMPIKWGIPVAIVGVAAISYGVYRIIKHYKKAA